MSEKTAIAVILVFSCALFSAAWYANNNRSNAQNITITPVTTPVETSQLKIVDTKIGTGAEAKSGKKITVHYTGKLADGTVFDTSRSRSEPFTFSLGAGEVIQGWDLGLTGMKVGGTRTLTIPPELAYGDTGQGPIPPKATLTFDIELLKVE